ncbi:Uncharacterised protein [Mycobacteroides abscessus subsp. abscessus]|nr:Uncharacterised protein [Mycobacteroides abscessus subsp. abscessus]SIB17436.1 Uncharacterised protein [Mycobacteroides abscessus subsp. abscessus]SLJ67789.1 Uncharacterised protein [Mycobacteroides abscessus subsp. abscessus]
MVVSGSVMVSHFASAQGPAKVTNGALAGEDQCFTYPMSSGSSPAS